MRGRVAEGADASRLIVPNLPVALLRVGDSIAKGTTNVGC
jgi:hypothetical protein